MGFRHIYIRRKDQSTYDPLGRLAYTIVANIMIGTIFGFIIINTVAASAGFLLFSLGDPASFDPIVIANVFAQTLPTSIAEVVVGTVFEFLARKRMSKEKDGTIGKEGGNIRSISILSVIVASLVSIILFGLYHFAHSPPFNQPNMVVFLMVPAILTSIFYFAGRSISAFSPHIHNTLKTNSRV